MKNFSISLSEAKRLGIVDEDLKCISEISPNTFRVSVRDAEDKRKTKVVHNLIEAIHLKYDFKKEVEEQKKFLSEKGKTLNESKTKITKYNSVRDSLSVYLKERFQDYQRGIIQITTYEQDVYDINFNRLLTQHGILDEIINNIDEEYAQNFVNYLWDTKLAENTIYKPFSLIRKLFNYYVKDLRIIKYNPFDNVKRKPQARSDDKEYCTTEEMHIIKEKLEFENIRFRTLITLIMDTGLRREEALAIKYSDINKLRGTIKIERAFVKSKIDGKFIIKPVKRKKSEREIIVTQYALDLIDKYRKFKEACGFIVNDDDFVFTAWDSLDLIDPELYSAEFRKFIKKIKIKTIIPFKNLRHTHATYFVEKGDNIKAVQKRLGHSNIETTLNIYAQTNLSEDRKLVDSYENEFYNKLGLSISELYQIVSNRFDNRKKIIDVLEKVCNEYIDDSNYDMQLERCQNYFRELFPIFDKILKIDSELNEDDIDAIFVGYTAKYRSVKIDGLEPQIKI